MATQATETVVWRALKWSVLAVAKVRADDSWCAWIDAVPGHDHDEEAEQVLKSGAPLPANVAAAIFPQLSGAYERR